MPSSTWEHFEVDAGDRADVLAEEQPISRGTLRAASLSLIGAARYPARSATMFEPAVFGLMADDPEVRPFIDSIQAVLTTDQSPDEVVGSLQSLVDLSGRAAVLTPPPTSTLLRPSPGDDTEPRIHRIEPAAVPVDGLQLERRYLLGRRTDGLPACGNSDGGLALPRHR